jgi:hypothetical protein
MIGYTPVRIAWFAIIAAGSMEVGAFGAEGTVETRFEERRAVSEVEDIATISHTHQLKVVPYENEESIVAPGEFDLI